MITHDFILKLRRRKNQRANRGYWNGEPCQAFNEERIVAHSETSTHWCNEFVGQKRKCVRVIYGREEFFLDDEDGSATYKVFQGRGSPWLSHKELIVEP